MIYELLNHGAAQALTGKQLGKLLHMTQREVSQAVERERRQGKPICATCNAIKPGYYIPETQEEMQQYCDRLRHRGGEIFATRAACLRSMNTLPKGESYHEQQESNQQ